MKLLLLDTETSGGVCQRVIEIGAALFDVGSRTVLWQFSSLIPGERANEVEQINHIPMAALAQTDGFYDPFEEVDHYADMAVAILAHNAAFDKRVLGDKLKTKTPWVCTLHNITFPRTGRSKKLSHIAIDHSVLPLGMHRALGDVSILAALCARTPDIEEQVKQALAKKAALVEATDEVVNGTAKAKKAK